MMPGGEINFGPPAGLAAILAQHDQELKDAGKSIGNFLGAAGGGIAGAMQGSASPGMFGAGTSSASGGAQGFLQNFASIGGYGPQGEGGGGGGGSAFSQMVNGGRGGQGGGGGGSTLGMTVNQLKLASKTADAFRNQMSAQTPQMEGHDAKVLGATNDEWDTMGAADKWSRVQGTVQGQMQSELQARLNDYAAQAQERNATASAMGDAGKFLGHVFTAPGAEGKDPSMMDRFAYAAKQMGTNWNSGRAMPGILSSLEKYAALGQNGNIAPQAFNVNGIPGVYSPKGGQFQIDPNYTVAQQIDRDTAKQAGKPSYRIKSVTNPLTGEVTPSVEADNLDDYQKGMEQLQKWQKAQAGGGNTGGGGSAPAKLNPNEVIRTTATGRNAVFDKSTKNFLRYAD